MHGRKLWLLWPPPHASYAQRHVALTLRDASLWGANTNASKGEGSARGAAPLRCEQRAGDVMVVPEVWGHATFNLEPSIGWATELSFDRSYDGGFSPSHGDEWWRMAARELPSDAPSASAAPTASPPAASPPASPEPSDHSPTSLRAGNAVPTLVEVVPSLHSLATDEVPRRDDSHGRRGQACEETGPSPAAPSHCHSALAARLAAAADAAEAVAAAAVAHANALRTAADEAFTGEQCTAPVGEASES